MRCASVRIFFVSLLAASFLCSPAFGRDYVPVTKPDLGTSLSGSRLPATQPTRAKPAPAASKAVRLPDTFPKAQEKSGGDEKRQSSSASASATAKPAGGASLGGGQKLFGTVEFQRPLESLPAWTDVIRRNLSDPIFIASKHFNKSTTWQTLANRAKNLGSMEKLRLVNSFWNGWPYREDSVNWGKPDYWAIPAQFLIKSGDCEDYAIVKYYTLKELGFDPASMRIVVLRDTLRHLAHAVLAVQLNGDIYILDNLSNVVLSHKRISNYNPQYSINELGRWTHIKGKGNR